MVFAPIAGKEAVVFLQMKKPFIFLSLLSIFLLQGCFSGNSGIAHLVISTAKDKVTYNLEIADTFEERKAGLMFRTSLPEKQGMLFVFDRINPYLL